MGTHQPSSTDMVYGSAPTRAPPPYRQPPRSPAVDGGDIEMAGGSEPSINAFEPPKNVASVYNSSSQNPLDPMACFKQTTAYIQQEQYLDPKYHGAGSTIAHMI